MLYRFVASDQQAIPCSLGVLYYLGLSKYTLAQRRDRLPTRLSERIPVVKRRIFVFQYYISHTIFKEDENNISRQLADMHLS
jgi:hypothetical protein